MQKKYLTLLIVMLSLLPGCSLKSTIPNYAELRPMEFGGPLLLPGGELQEEQDFKLFFRKADYVLIGEAHTNMTDHISQALILEKMLQKRLKPILGLEMVDVENQHILDNFNSGELSVDQLETALNWSKTVGYSFELYRPIFEVAARYKIPAHALNIPRRVVHEARLKGLNKVSEQDKKYLPAEFIPASEAQRDYLLDFFSLHIERNGPDMLQAMPNPNSKLRPTASAPESMGSDAANRIGVDLPAAGDDKSRPVSGAQKRPGTMQPKPTLEAEAYSRERQAMLEGFLSAQAIWDSVMAEQAVRLHQASGRPVVILAGQGHVEQAWGIARRLAVYDPKAQIVSVMPWRAPMEVVFMLKQNSPLQDSAIPAVFPPANLADIYYYSPLSPPGKTPQGLITAQNPQSPDPELVVLGVVPGSPAQKAGIMAGDTILQLERREIKNGGDFYNLLAQFAAYNTAPTLTLKRGEEKLNVVLPVN